MTTESTAVVNVATQKQKSGRYATFQRMVSFCRPETAQLSIGFLSLFVNSYTNAKFPELMGRSLDQAGARCNDFFYQSAIMLVAGSAASWLRVSCLGGATESISARMRKELFESYLEKDIEYFDMTKMGEVVKSLDEDVNIASETLTERLASGFRSLNSAIVGSTMLYFISPRLCAVSLGVVPFIGIGAMTISRFTSSLTKQLRTLTSDILSFSMERIMNISTVKLSNREAHEKAKYGEILDKSSRLAAKRFNWRGALMGFINLSTNLSLIGLFHEGGRLIAQGAISQGDLTRFAVQVGLISVSFICI
jgi:ABC-type multidrug transport system fused ATPase/permease subunit